MASRPAANAALVADAQAPSSRMVRVTVDGERRLMRVVDVPLGPAGVAGYAIDMHELEQARAELKHLIQANRDMLDRFRQASCNSVPTRSCNSAISRS